MHPASERLSDLINLIVFSLFSRKYLLVDPNELEERCMSGKLVVGMNRHREICTMQMSGNVLLEKEQVLVSCLAPS